jgi:xylulokinase
MTRALLGMDVGTSGVKALLLDADGTVLARATASYPLSSPRPLWSEQQPEDWWTAVLACIRALCAQPGITPASIQAVGLTGQMHGLVALDREGAVLRPAILWNDQRTARECAAMTEEAGAADILRITGKPLLPSFTAPKLRWLRDHEPDTHARIATALLPKDYIRYRLTGTLFTDVSDASGMSVFDVGGRCWSGDLQRAFGFPASWFADATESPEVSAFVSSEAAALTGLLAGTPVVGGAGDQAAEALGCGVLGEGAVSVTIGTSGVVFSGMTAYRYEPEGRLHAYCHAAPGVWHVMGVMLSAGGSLRWYRDALCAEEAQRAAEYGVDVYDLLAEYAAMAPAGCEGLLFLPYLSGERTPHADPHARGVFFGLTTRHRKHEMTRAVFEGVSYGLRDGVTLLREIGIDVAEVRCSGGGARSAFWRRMLADMLHAKVRTVNVTEGAAYGAALLAGVGAGVYAHPAEAVARTVRAGEAVDPGSDAAVYDRHAPRYRALYTALREQFRAVDDTPGGN